MLHPSGTTGDLESNKRHSWLMHEIRESAKIVGMCWYHREARNVFMGHLNEIAALETANPWLFEDSDLEEEEGEEEMQEDVDVELEIMHRDNAQALDVELL